MKQVLIITNYFPPETGAASNRIFHLADGLQKRGLSVQVTTPLPNYPKGKIFKSYGGLFKKTTVEHNITINRLWIYASNSKNKLLRLFAMLSYSFSLVWYIVWNKIPKTVIIQSPPLLVAFTCLLFIKSKKHKLILNISDLWPLAGLELGVFKKGWSYNLLEKIERFNYKKADLILGQSDEILTHVKSIFPDKETFLYRNYPDFVSPKIIEKKVTNDKVKMVYAGLLGVAQGIYELTKHLDYSNIEFHIYGDGNEKSLIKSFIKANPLLPIYYHGEIKRELLHQELIKYDVTIIPLRNRIYGSVPSKIFEYARLGLPILYFGGGEGENIIKQYNLGWVVDVGDYKLLNSTLNNISNDGFAFEVKKRILLKAHESFSFEKQIDSLLELF